MKIKYSLSIAMAVMILGTTIGNATYIESNISSYKDTKGHWSEATILEALTNEIIPDGESFRPDDFITRFEFAQMMNQALNIEVKSDKTFIDLPKGSQKEAEILKAVGQGYIVGYEDNTVRPDNHLLRQEASAMVVSALKLVDNQNAAQKYSDYANIEDYAKGKVGAVSLIGIMGGTPENQFKPLDTLTRAEALVIALNVKAKTIPDTIIEKDGTIIKDQTILGNLIIAEELGNGNATIENVTVKGKTIVKGGGDNSIHIKNSTIGGLVAADPKGTVRIVLEGTTTVSNIQVENGVNLESDKTFTGTVNTIEITSNQVENQTLTMNVPIQNLIISSNTETKVLVKQSVQNLTIMPPKQGENTQTTKVPVIDIAKGVEVKTLIAESKVDIIGQGTIENLQANVSGITTTIKPDNIQAKPGIEEPEIIKEESQPSTEDKEIKYDQTVSSAIIHFADKTTVQGNSSLGKIELDLKDKEGIITGITFNSDSQNTYTVTQIQSPNQGSKSGSWNCQTNEQQPMSMFINIASSELGFGGNSNTNAMPTAVIRGYGGTGDYEVEGNINGKILNIKIIL